MGTKIDLAATMEKAEKEGMLSTSSTFKLKEGDNRVRVVDGFLPHNSEFTGKDGKTTKNFKWLTRVIDRRDGKVKAFFMGHTIYKQLVAFQKDTVSGTNFDELPMPYDINISAVGAGTMEVKYTVVASRNSTPLSLAEQAMIGAEDSLEELRDALNKKKPQAPSGPVHHDIEGGFDPDEIPG